MNDDVLDTRDLEQELQQLLCEKENLLCNLDDEEKKVFNEDNDEFLLNHLDDYEYLKDLLALKESIGVENWEFGVTLIQDSYWTDFAIEEADEFLFCYIPSGWARDKAKEYFDYSQWADYIQSDYSTCELYGYTYWYRI